MSQPRVLITGAGGFIGRHLVRHQLERGRWVRALDRRADGLKDLKSPDIYSEGMPNLVWAKSGIWPGFATEGSPGRAKLKPLNLTALNLPERLEVMVGDVADRAIQRKAVAGVDLVFHLASAHLETGLSEAEYHRINVAAVETLLEESQKAGVRRFVHVSSCGVHGQVENWPADEETPFHPDIAYERTKLAGELLARDFQRRDGFPVVVVRPVWVYGPGCQRTARLFRLMAKGRFIMIGRGLNLRSAVYITDFLDALERCATQPGIEGEVFIVTHNERVTVGQIVDEIARLVGKPRPRLRIPVGLAWGGAALMESLAGSLGRQPPITRRSLKFFTNDAGFTCAKAQRLLGFEPQVPLRVGLELTYRWWRENTGGS